MREIKFDAIYKPTGEHFTPVNINFENKTTHGNFDGQVNDWCHFSLDGGYGDAILRQYTGLKDKNGKEIYEGDIVEHKDYSAGAIIFGGNQPTCRSVIQWKNYYNGYHLAGLGNPFKGEELEVIGNIYENPDLIKTK